MMCAGMSARSKRAGETRYGEAPRERPRRAVPRGSGIAATPRDHPIAQPPAARAVRLPKPRASGAVPNPRKPKLVRDVDGGALKDLFALLPDLPRPPRPAPRVRPRVGRRALTRGVR
jgi:hypothetical protein